MSENKPHFLGKNTSNKVCFKNFNFFLDFQNFRFLQRGYPWHQKLWNKKSEYLLNQAKSENMIKTTFFGIHPAIFVPNISSFAWKLWRWEPHQFLIKFGKNLQLWTEKSSISWFLADHWLRSSKCADSADFFDIKHFSLRLLVYFWRPISSKTSLKWKIEIEKFYPFYPEHDFFDFVKP